jgi:hypothetical protein
MHSHFVTHVLKGELPSHIFMSVNQQNAKKWHESDITNAWNEHYKISYHTL